jgi:hypothetical protein
MSSRTNCVLLASVMAILTLPALLGWLRLPASACPLVGHVVSKLCCSGHLPASTCLHNMAVLVQLSCNPSTLSEKHASSFLVLLFFGLVTKCRLLVVRMTWNEEVKGWSSIQRFVSFCLHLFEDKQEKKMQTPKNHCPARRRVAISLGGTQTKSTKPIKSRQDPAFDQVISDLFMEAAEVRLGYKT